MAKFQVQLQTKDGRLFVLASHGWTSQTDHRNIRKFDVKTEAVSAMRRAWRRADDRMCVVESAD